MTRLVLITAAALTLSASQIALADADYTDYLQASNATARQGLAKAASTTPAWTPSSALDYNGEGSSPATSGVANWGPAQARDYTGGVASPAADEVAQAPAWNPIYARDYNGEAPHF